MYYAWKLKIYRFYINKMITSFVWWQITGTKDIKISEKRDKSSKKLVNIVAQQIIHSFKTDRQTSYAPTSDSRYINDIETPFSTDLRLTIHKKNRSKDLLNAVSHLQIRANSEEPKGMSP